MFRLIKSILRFIFFIILLVIGVFCYARYIEPNMLKEVDVTVTSPTLPSEAYDLKIAVFGDTQFGDYYNMEDFERILNALEDEEPDVVVFTGDLIDYYDIYTGDVSEISEAFAKIEAHYGKFAIFGNHDYGGGAEYKYKSIMEAGGFTVLKNEYFAIDERKIAIIGIDDVLIGYGDPIIASWGRPDYYNIILAHEPDLVDEVLVYNSDLMISGHTHGRQINIKFFDDYILPPYGKKYIHGLFQFDNERQTQLYVNAGVGMSTLPYRFLSPPELTLITLKPPHGSGAEE